jgi:hypothetical protein
MTTLRDQLDQIARLEEKATQGEWRIREMGRDFFVERPKQSGEAYGIEILGDDTYDTKRGDAEFIAALVNFWRSGGRELAEDGLQWRRIRELADDNQRIMVEMIEKHEAARAPSVKEGKS